MKVFWVVVMRADERPFWWLKSKIYKTLKILNIFGTTPKITNFIYKLLIWRVAVSKKVIMNLYGNTPWWWRNSHQWDARSLRPRVTYTRRENKNTLQKAPVWSRPNTLRRLSQKPFYNSRVLERNQSRVPWCEEDVGAFIVVRSCLLSFQSKSYPCRASLILVGQVFSLLDKSFPCRASLLLVGQVFPLLDKSCPRSPSPFLAKQVFRNLKRGGQVWAFVLLGTPHKEWDRPSFDPWTWTRWARQALSHILSSSAAPFTPFGPSLLCKRSIGVTVKTVMIVLCSWGRRIDIHERWQRRTRMVIVNTEWLVT